MTESEQKVFDILGTQKFDIGIMGMWYGANYGSVMTYYALNTVLSRLGYSVLMLDKQAVETKGFEFELDDTSHARVFAKTHYKNFAPSLPVEDMKVLNNYCDTFMLGCDQVWNFTIAKSYGLNYYLDFANSDKKRIAYASSFGHEVSFTPLEKVAGVTRELQKFDAISVREESGVRVLKDEFGIKGTQVLDPVFLLDENGKVNADTDFVFYNNLKHSSGAVEHLGDNLTGEGDGDDEQVKVDLSLVPQNISKIAFTVTIHEALERRQNFGQVNNSYVRLVNSDNEEELLRYDLGEEFSIETAIVVCEIYRHNGEWKFSAVGSGFEGGLEALCKNFGVNV